MSETITMIDIKKIKPAKRQLRKGFDEEKIQELAESISTTGLLQPIIVRENNGDYEIISGHRRIEAYKKLKLIEIPAIIKDLDNGAAFEASIIENLQRDDLSPVEEAEAFKTLIDEYHYSQKRLAEKIGKSDTYISNRLGIISVEETVKEDLQEGKLQVSHVRSIKRLDKPVKQTKFADFIKEKEIGPQKAEKISTEIRKLETKLKEDGLLTDDIKPESEEVIFEEVMDKAYRKVELGISDHNSDLEPLPLDIDYLHKFNSSEDRLMLPLKAQFHKKMLWNLKRISTGNFDFFTTGSSQKDPEYLVELMKEVGAKLLIDIRKNAKSIYRPEFNDNALEHIFKEAGLDYYHWPEYGVPKLIRNQLATSKITIKEFFNHYDEEILTKEKIEKLRKEIEKKGKIVFLCSEVNPEDCHRHRVALALEAKGLNSFDL